LLGFQSLHCWSVFKDKTAVTISVFDELRSLPLNELLGMGDCSNDKGGLVQLSANMIIIQVSAVADKPTKRATLRQTCSTANKGERSV